MRVIEPLDEQGKIASILDLTKSEVVGKLGMPYSLRYLPAIEGDFAIWFWPQYEMAEKTQGSVGFKGILRGPFSDGHGGKSDFGYAIKHPDGKTEKVNVGVSNANKEVVFTRSSGYCLIEDVEVIKYKVSEAFGDSVITRTKYSEAGVEKSVYGSYGYETSFEKETTDSITELHSLPETRTVVLRKTTDKATEQETYELCIKRRISSRKNYSLEEIADNPETICQLNEQGYLKVLKAIDDERPEAVHSFASAAAAHMRKYSTASKVSLGTVMGVGKYMINQPASTKMMAGMISFVEGMRRDRRVVKSLVTGKGL